jgi:predicted TIM-barrel fold metal-dependent hydrolase
MIIDSHTTIENDTALTKLLNSMDSNQVDISVIAPSKHEFAFENNFGNQRMAKYCKQHKNLRFWGVVTPWSSEVGAAEAHRALSDGAIGLIFDSSTQGFSLLDYEIQALLDTIKIDNLPIYFHTGTPVLALPLQLAFLADKFPEFVFIMGRSGRTDFRTDAIPALNQSRNLFADTSHDYPDTGLLGLHSAVGSSRMIFTSDYPFESQKFGISAINRMPVGSLDKANILGLNAKEIMKVNL